MATSDQEARRTDQETGEEEQDIDEKWKKCVFLLIGNIPAKFRSADLRAVFSHYVEKGCFLCFHYRHRPEQIQDKSDASTSNPTLVTTETATTSASGSCDTSSTHYGQSGSTHSEHGGPAQGVGVVKTNCCVVAMERSEREADGGATEFVQAYANKNWSTADGGLLRQRVRISELKVDFDIEQDQCSPQDLRSSSSTAVPWEELKLLPELNPPSVMPRGNVGTPLSTFMELIRTCKLPAHVIRKLQLEFPKSRSRKRYGAVGLDYGTEVVLGEGGEIEGGLSNRGNRLGGREWRKRRSVERERESTEREEDTIPPDDDHDAEEWERYEAFHNDVDKQERGKERLYEEELEVVWDKGSSGLVFYTDASYWDQQDGDFDEKCSKEDDWDVDMSAYYDCEGGDKDARDMRDIEMERRLREGKAIGSWTGAAGFEKHTKGFGSMVLKRSGWTEGSGVGAARQGIAEPLEAEGQHPRSKRGLGYRGEKLDRSAPSAKRKKATRDVIISTIYDQPSEQEDTVLRSAPSTTLKYRTGNQQVHFCKGDVLRTPSDSQSDQNTHDHHAHS